MNDTERLLNVLSDALCTLRRISWRYCHANGLPLLSDREMDEAFLQLEQLLGEYGWPTCIKH